MNGPRFHHKSINMHYHLPHPNCSTYGRSRRRHLFNIAACVMLMFQDQPDVHLRGRLLSSKNIKRTRGDVEHMMSQLGPCDTRAWKSNLEEFSLLHGTLHDQLIEQIGSGERKRGSTPNGEVPTKLRLSAAYGSSRVHLFMISC